MSHTTATDAGITLEGRLAPHDYETGSLFPTSSEGERRLGLRRLDDVLEALGEFHLRQAGKIPASLRERLLDQGVPIVGNSIIELVDLVLGSQERFMLLERRAGGRRRRGRVLHSDDDLISVIARRCHG